MNTQTRPPPAVVSGWCAAPRLPPRACQRRMHGCNKQKRGRHTTYYCCIRATVVTFLIFRFLDFQFFMEKQSVARRVPPPKKNAPRRGLGLVWRFPPPTTGLSATDARMQQTREGSAYNLLLLHPCIRGHLFNFSIPRFSFLVEKQSAARRV